MVLDYEERYGEHVGFCRVHRQRVLGSCDDCEQDDSYHDPVCMYCSKNFSCDCEWPGDGHMCPRCDLLAEETKIPSHRS
jgi:hypothetical protein